MAPLPGIANNVGDTTTLEKYVPAIFKLAVGLSAVAAVLMIVIGGFQYISSDAILGKTAGRERIMNAIYALVLIIGAWLILNTINPNLLKIKLNIDKVSVDSAVSGQLYLGVPNSGNGGTATGADLLSGATLADDAAIRAQLASEGLSINQPPCTADRTSNCTNLDGLPASMVTTLGALETACTQSVGTACTIMITGGTESSLHTAGTSHAPGKSTVDLRSTDTLNAYLGDPAPASGDKVVVNGLNFTYESTGDNGAATGNHWHVTAVTP